jgi:hypothetical protein
VRDKISDDEKEKISGGGHEVGGEGRDDGRAHDDQTLHERAERLPEVQHGSKLHLLRWTKVRYQTCTVFQYVDSVSKMFC